MCGNIIAIRCESVSKPTFGKPSILVTHYAASAAYSEQ
jgi:hypothetical protein